MNVSPWKRKLAEVPLLGSSIVFIYRFRGAMSYYWTPLGKIFAWLFQSNELDNYTTNLDPRNRLHLASFIAVLTGCSRVQVTGWFDELEQDRQLRDHIASAVSKSSEKKFADSEARYGRRLGWYAFVRALKPRVVVETGVEKGLGSVVLAAALKRNAEEGAAGFHYGLDIDTVAGYLLSGHYAAFGKIVFGDSIETLKSFDKKIDLFINDSDHSCEAKEYETIRDKLSQNAVILGDNSHGCDSLIDFAEVSGRKFLYFQEKTDGWYPGAGIGVAYEQGGLKRFQ
jgi:hypothetical protein